MLINYGGIFTAQSHYIVLNKCIIINFEL